jgi:hypothetical protein
VQPEVLDVVAADIDLQIIARESRPRLSYHHDPHAERGRPRPHQRQKGSNPIEENMNAHAGNVFAHRPGTLPSRQPPS